MSNEQLTHDFLEWLMENYAVRLEMDKEDENLFERRYPDLAEKMDKKNKFIEEYCIPCTMHSDEDDGFMGEYCTHYEECIKRRAINND